MTSTQRRPVTTPIILSLLCGGLLCSVDAGAYEKTANSIPHGTHLAKELAWTAGEQLAPAPLDQVISAANTAKDVAAAGAGAYTTSAVLGSSAPAILTALKAVGGPIGVGGASGLSIASLQSKYLYSDCEKTTACDAASVSGYVGAGAGTAGALALGSFYGVGATGLVGIGSLVGGGMAVGAISLIALPAVGAVAIGAGVYGLVSWLTD